MNVLVKLKKMIGEDIRRYHIEQRAIAAFGNGSPEHVLIMKASDASREVLRGGRRKNGEPLIVHERSMFIIAFDYLGIRDVDILVAIFMHDMYEDYSKIWPLHRIESEFGKEVRVLVAAVSKPKRLFYHSDEAYDKLIFRRVYNGGVKAMVLKCIDRLHNMLTLYGTKEKMEAKVFQTWEHVMPISIKCKTLRLELALATTEQMEWLDMEVIPANIFT